MRVRELIARLSELDPELPVVMPDDRTGDFCEVDAAFIDTVATVKGTLQLCHDYEQGSRPAIRLFGPETDFTASPPIDD